MPEIHKISKSKKLKGYRDVMLSEGLNPDARIDLVEKYDGVKNTLLEMKLGTHIDGRFTLDDELSALLALKRKTTRKTSAENTKMIFAFYLFRHFILKSKRSREGSSRLPPFDKEHLSLLGDVLGILQRPPYLLNESLALVKQKIDAEALQPRIGSRLFGSAFVFLTTGKSIDWCVGHFGVDSKELKNAAKSIAGLVGSREDKLAELGLSKRSRRAAEFTELVKDAGDKGKRRSKK